MCRTLGAIYKPYNISVHEDYKPSPFDFQYNDGLLINLKENTISLDKYMTLGIIYSLNADMKGN